MSIPQPCVDNGSCAIGARSYSLLFRLARGESALQVGQLAFTAKIRQNIIVLMKVQILLNADRDFPLHQFLVKRDCDRKECSFNIVLLAAGLGGVSRESDPLKILSDGLKKLSKEIIQINYHSAVSGSSVSLLRCLFLSRV